MPANPFTIDISGSNPYQGLSGLADTITQVGERKKRDEAIQAQADQQTASRTEIQEAMATGDPDQIRAVMAKYPEAAKGLKAAVETKFPGESGNALKTALFKASLDFEQAPAAIDELEKQFAKDGLDQNEIAKLDNMRSMIIYQKDDAKKEILAEFAALTAGEKGGLWDRYQDIKGEGAETKLPTTAMGQFIKKNPNATSDQLIKFTQDLKAGDAETTVKTYSKKNPDGSTRTVPNVKPGSEQEAKLLEIGFVEGTQTIGAKMSSQERADKKTMDNIGKLSAMANEDPNKFYEEQSYRMNDDGSLYLDPVTDLPTKLMPFFKATGKRGNIKAMQGLGEQWDDAKELQELLSIPQVQENLSKANADGIWDKVSGKWSNTINKWMQDKGIGGNSNTATAIARIQKMASEERKLYMGTAVTDNEMKSALAWMPSAGDSYESMVNKTALMGKEAEQAFRRWIDIFSKDADMSPFYKAFGIKRFGAEEEAQPETGKIKFLGFE